MAGLLHFMPLPEGDSDESEWAMVMEHMESEKRRTFVEMARATTALASWEMKSTSAGPQEVMGAVGSFPGRFCDSEACSAT
jgi:hypothetical protein